MLSIVARARTARLSLRSGLDKLRADRSGATAIEYGLIAAGIAVAIIAAVFARRRDQGLP